MLGSLVARLDADDYCLPDSTRELRYAAFRDDPRARPAATADRRVSPGRGIVTHVGSRHLYPRRPRGGSCRPATGCVTAPPCSGRMRASRPADTSRMVSGGGLRPVAPPARARRVRAIPAVTVRCLENLQGISSTHVDQQGAAARARSETALRLDGVGRRAIPTSLPYSPALQRPRDPTGRGPGPRIGRGRDRSRPEAARHPQFGSPCPGVGHRPSSLRRTPSPCPALRDPAGVTVALRPGSRRGRRRQR